MAKQIRTLAEKIRLIEEVEKHPFEKRVEIAKRLKLPPSTLNSIISKKDEIRKQVDKYGASAKKRKTGRESTYKDLETVLYDWYRQARALQIPIDGTILREKALEIATLKGIENFTASNGWISRFKERHGLNFKKLCGQSAAVDDSVVQDWLSRLPTLIEGFDPRDIYNADETGLFYKCLPDRSLTLKGEACHGGKNSKERLTILLCSNSDGSDKRVPFVIGKSAKPRCFKNVKTLPVTYRANSKAWMTNEFFSLFLRDFDDSIGKEKRKVILFIDNCSAHSPDVSFLKNVKVIFYPPNCTSRVQPLDLGIIHSFKSHYRKNLVRKSLAAMDQGDYSSFKIDVLQAIYFIVSAWERVTSLVIKNCFNKAIGNVVEIQEIENVTSNDEEENCLSQFGTINLTFDDYTSVDEEVATCGLVSIQEMITETEEKDDSSTDEEQVNSEPPPSFPEALKAYETMRNFLYSNELSETEQKHITNIENLLFRFNRKKCVQTQISRYFK